MNTYRKKNYRGKRNFSGRPSRRNVDTYHQPLPPDREKIPCYRHTLTKPDVEAVVDALLSGTLVQGREIERFESLLAKLTHSEFAIAVNSGTAALHTALSCLKLEPEDEVILCTLSFYGNLNIVRQVGAKAVLVDCDAQTGTIDVAGVKAAINDQTKAILASNFGGHPSDLHALRELCDEHALVLIEDASHGLGGKYRGHYVGNQADITCFSFHPSMAITTCEGGAVTTNNRAIADWIRLFRQHGLQKEKRYFTNDSPQPAYYAELPFPGMNYMLSEVHAALGRSQLTRLDRHIERRRSIAQVYFQKLSGVAGLSLPHVAEWADSAFHFYTVQFTQGLAIKRDDIFKEMRDLNIEVDVHYIPVHRMQPSGPNLGSPNQFPNAESFFAGSLSLPLFPDLSYKDIERITEALLKLVQKYGADIIVQEPEPVASTEPSEIREAKAAEGESDSQETPVSDSLEEPNQSGDSSAEPDKDKTPNDQPISDLGNQEAPKAASETEPPPEEPAAKPRRTRTRRTTRSSSRLRKVPKDKAAAEETAAQEPTQKDAPAAEAKTSPPVATATVEKKAEKSESEEPPPEKPKRRARTTRTTRSPRTRKTAATKEKTDKATGKAAEKAEGAAPKPRTRKPRTRKPAAAKAEKKEPPVGDKGES